MIEKLNPAPKVYIEHQGIQYARFDDIEREGEAEYTPPQVVEIGGRDMFVDERSEMVASWVTLTNVRWRSDQGRTKPHDVTITGEYTMHIPQEDQ